MTGTDVLLVEHPSDDIVVLRLNRPQVRNALNIDVRLRLAAEIARYGADSTTRCLIITGSDTVFAAGADITEMAGAGPVEVMARNVQQYYRAIMDCPKPVIAAVEGFALGGGLELALCADIIVVGEGAKMGLPEVKLGILAGGGGTQKLARLVGLKRAMLLLLTGRMFGATEAVAMGVASEAVPAGQALPRAAGFAKGQTPTVVDATAGLGRDAFLRQQSAILHRPDSRPDLGHIRVPTWVAVGAGDQLTPPVLAEEIAAGIPGARLEVIEGCGHLPPMEAPERTSALMRNWLD